MGKGIPMALLVHGKKRRKVIGSRSLFVCFTKGVMA